MAEPLKIRSVRWDITHLCNLNCVHCYSGPDDIRDQDFGEVVEIVEKLVPMGLREINLSGREPTLRRDLITICQWCRQKGLVVNVTTNGTVWEPRVYEELLKTDLNMLVFSLDGNTASVHDRIRGSGNFDITVDNIRHCTGYLRRSGATSKIGISLTLQKYNAREAAGMVNAGIEMGIDFLGINPVSYCGVAAKTRNRIYLSSREIEQCWEDICSRYVEYEPRFELYLGIFPMEAKYLNVRYGLDLPVVYTGCSAGKTIYLDPAGRALPCYMLPAMAGIRPELNRFLKPWDILKEPAEQGAGIFEPFISFARTYSQKDDRGCSDCVDVDVCRRCPLIALSDQDAVTRCQRARARLDSLRLRMPEDAIITIKEHVQWKMNSGILCLHIKKGGYFNAKTLELDPVAQEIWRGLNGIHTLADIKSDLKAKFPAVNAPEIERDINDVIHYLWKEGIVSTEDDEKKHLA